MKPEKEALQIAQKIISNGRDQEGTGLISWEKSASYLIEGYGENKKQNALQKALSFIEDRENAYKQFCNEGKTANDHFFRGYLTALDKVKQMIIKLSDEEMSVIE